MSQRKYTVGPKHYRGGRAAKSDCDSLLILLRRWKVEHTVIERNESELKRVRLSAGTSRVEGTVGAVVDFVFNDDDTLNHVDALERIW